MELYYNKNRWYFYGVLRCRRCCHHPFEDLAFSVRNKEETKCKTKHWGRCGNRNTAQEAAQIKDSGLDMLHMRDLSIHSNIKFTMETESAASPFWTLIHTEDQMAPWVTPYTGSRSIPTCTVIWQINILYYPPWYRGLKQSVTWIVCQENWNSTTVSSNRIATIIDRSFVLSIHLRRKLHLQKIQQWQPSHPLCKTHLQPH